MEPTYHPKLKLTRADTIFVQNLDTILKHGTKDENPRPKYEDGTPAHTLFITDTYEKYYGKEVPITSLRPTAWKTGIREVAWIFQKQTSDLDTAEELGLKWWRSWRVEGQNDIGHVYGETVNRYDLIDRLLEGLEKNPFGRRHIINLWQEEDFKEPHGLKPCAYETMWSVRKDNNGRYILDLFLNQRSNDYLVASSINLVQYKALQMMVAKHLGYEVGTFSRHVQNLHIYDRHIDQAKQLIESYNELKEKDLWSNVAPELHLNVPDGTNFYDITVDDFELKNYHPVKYEPKMTFDLGI